MHEINDEYAVKYQYINEDGSLGRRLEQTIPLYSLPTLLKTLAKSRVVITSCEKVSE